MVPLTWADPNPSVSLMLSTKNTGTSNHIYDKDKVFYKTFTTPFDGFVGIFGSPLSPEFHVNGVNSYSAMINSTVDSQQNFYVSVYTAEIDQVAVYNDSSDTSQSNVSSIPYVNNNDGNADCCIIKYSSAGNFGHMLYTYTQVDASNSNGDNQMSPKSMCTDPSNNLYFGVTSFLQGESFVYTNISKIDRNTTTLSSSDRKTISKKLGPTGIKCYIVKWDSSGNYKSVAYFSSSSYDYLFAIAYSDTAASLYAGVSMKSSSTTISFYDFYQSTQSNTNFQVRKLPSTTRCVLFKLKPDSSSSAEPHAALGHSTGVENEAITSISVDSVGNVYVTCFVPSSDLQISTPTFDTSNTPEYVMSVPGASGDYSFMHTLIKYDASLNVLWVVNGYSSVTNESPTSNVYGTNGNLSRTPGSLCCTTGSYVYFIFYCLDAYKIDGKYIKSVPVSASTSNNINTFNETNTGTVFAVLVRYTFEGIYQDHVEFKYLAEVTKTNYKIKNLRSIGSRVFVSFEYHGKLKVGTLEVGTGNGRGTVLFNATNPSAVTLVCYVDSEKA